MQEQIQSDHELGIFVIFLKIKEYYFNKKKTFKIKEIKGDNRVLMGF